MKGQQRLLYLLPACILVFAFFLFPLAYLSYISFFEWDGLGPKTFVGFENFEYVFIYLIVLLFFIRFMYVVLVCTFI